MFFNRLNQYCGEVKKYTQVLIDETKHSSKRYPFSTSGLGIALFPVNSILEGIAQKTFNLMGIETLDLIAILERTEGQLRTSQRELKVLHEYPSYPIKVIESMVLSAAAQILLGEVVQNFLLDKQLTKVLPKIAPVHANFTQTTQGKIVRIVATSLISAGFSYLNNMQNRTHQIYENGFLINSQWTHTYSHSTSYSIAAAVNEFMLTFLASASREITGSNLPGIVLRCLRNFSI